MTTATPHRGTATSSVTDAYPLSRLQAGMIYHAELEGDASYYHDIYSLRVHGPWHEESFRAAVAGLTEAHDVLRTSFELAKFSEPLQLVHSTVDVPFETVDLRGLEREAAEQVLADWRREETGRPFDFAAAPLFRMVVHRLGDEEFHFWWSFHHAMMDGWSLHSAVAELFGGYTAIRTGRNPDFTAPRTRYRDYIALELDALDDARQRDFWRDQLAGAEPAVLPVPPRRTSDELDSTVAVEWYDIPRPVLDRLGELATRLRVPVRTVLLTAHLRVVSGLLGRSDVITGVVGNGRPETRDAEQVKGLFLSTYPLRTALPRASWADFATAVFAQEAAILPNRRYPLAAMVEETGWSPFDIVFDFRRFRSYEGLTAQGDLAFDIGDYYEHTNFPLTSGFVMNPEGTSLRLQLRYDARRFDRADTARLGRAYLSVLERIAADPDSAVLAAPALADEDVAALAVHGSGPWRDTARPHGVHQRIERAARSGRTAVRAIDGELSYDELLEVAGRIAGGLAEAGVRRGDPVGVCMNRGTLLVPALLAIWRIGANYVSLDPDYPLDRLRYIARHSGAEFLLHDAASARVAAELAPASLAVETAGAHPRSAEAVEVSGDELAYTIYTSGSTGLPKGVEVPHGSVVNFLDALVERLDLDDSHPYLATTSISFDIHVNEMFVPLILGGTVLLAARSQVADGAALRELIESAPGLIAQGPPAMWRMLLDTGWRPKDMAGVLCGGEAFPRDLAERLSRDGAAVWNMYGPTETTVWSAVQRVADGEGTVPIGRPIRNTTMWVLDAHMDPVFPGVPGELYIGGEGVVRAYHDRPDLTADRFVPDPFAGPGRPGARLYRTGDLVRVGENGTFEYLERVDLQVKVRGYRIELEEVEARLGRHPEVSAAVVAAPLGTDGERVLAGYVVAAPGVDGGALRTWCAEALPGYMVPQAWVLLDALPLTPNGKVDRKALPGIGEAMSSAAGDTAAPGNDTERALAAIWSEVLGVTGIGVNANFFDIGGHSLRALRVVLKVRDELGVELPVAALLQAATIRRLAALIDRRDADGTDGVDTLVVPLNSAGSSPLFLFPPLGGHIFGYGPLARLLDGEVTVYGVRASGMEPGEEPLDTMSGLADHYVARLKAAQPEGPYHLAGWCMGATVAVEVARRLREAGDEVGYLGLVVANPFDPAPRRLLEDPTALVHHMLGQGTDTTYEELAAIDGLDEKIELVFSRGRSAGALRDDVSSVEDARRLLRVYQANAKAISSHRQTEYDGAAQVFVLPEEDFRPVDMGWSQVITGPTTLHGLPGLPATFLTRDEVGRLAEVIADELSHRAAR
ncbi:non-ribosomal peptide synthetase [Streptomyces sp. NPDC002755]|uniref:non-ribosomal peptide synthetase n=1 Tax=Streptomyces sp. NPDC002884 TaxID=3154544 RepID=UPI00331D827F